MFEFTVYENEWYRGKLNYTSRLLGKDNKKCCLGFLALQDNLSDEDIIEERTPADVYPLLKKTKYLKLLVDKKEARNTIICRNIMVINDSNKISDSVRKKKLREQFKKLGIKIKFKKEAPHV